MTDGSSVSAVERRLVLRVLQKDQAALEELAAFCAARVISSLERRYQDLLDELEMNGVLNQVVYNVWRSAGSYDPAKGSFSGWMYRIAEREVINCLRQHQSSGCASMLEFEPPVRARRPDDSSRTDQPVVKELLAVIEELPPLQRAVIRADLAAGERADDARLAKRHGTTVNSIRSSRSTARRKIRQALEQRMSGSRSA